MNFWGASRWDDSADAATGGGPTNPYVKNHFEGSLELCSMMLEYYRYTKDRDYARHTVLPFIDSTLQFFFEHNRIRNGKLFLRGLSAMETWWEADDPADQIAGLLAVVPGALRLGEAVGAGSDMMEKWRIYAGQLPELPLGKLIFQNSEWSGVEPFDSILPAAHVDHRKIENSEDPELYPVWPFALYGIGQPDLECAKNTFDQRIQKRPRNGWSQTAVWAARLGLSDQAASLAMKHFEYNGNIPGGMMDCPSGRYPGRNDVPDCPYFDTIGVAATAVNEMLMQDHTGKVLTFPGWPANEKASFKLHAADGVVEAEI
jgi:hypothetical protein